MNRDEDPVFFPCALIGATLGAPVAHRLTPWFVTWSTYGAWLPGDPRGFQTWRRERYVPPPLRYARGGEKPYRPEDYVGLFEYSRSMSRGAVRFARAQQHVAMDAMTARIERMRPKVRPALIVLNRWHFHFIARFPAIRIRQAVGQYKQSATAALGPPPGAAPRWWVEGCHMHSLDDAEAVRNAAAYLWSHVAQGDLFHSWIGDWGREDSRLRLG